jgi:pimeloyl-ACP methyl ester carboxylesterase
VTVGDANRARYLARRLLALTLVFVACGEATTNGEPSPEVVDTAEAISRQISIDAPYSTTPAPDDDDRDAPIVLDGRVFGDGDTGVVLAHMRPADQTSWFPLATKLAASGEYTVLTFDFRGFGASTGDKEFDRVDTDLQAALRYMREELGRRRVFLVGASMGGSAALIVAAREPVAGVVSISSPALLQEVDALSVVSRISSPKLFIASDDDLNAERSLEQFWQQATEPKEREVYDGDAHGTDLFASEVAPHFERRIIDFLDAH